MKLIRKILVLLFTLFFICDAYSISSSQELFNKMLPRESRNTENANSTSVAIYTDIQTRKDSFNRTDAVFSPDSKYVVHTFGKPSIYFYNIYDASISFRIDYDKSMIVKHIEFSPDGNYMAVIIGNFYNDHECLLYVYETKIYSLIFEKKIFNNSYEIQESKLFTSDSQYIVFCEDFVEGTELVFLNFKTSQIEKHFHSRGPIDEIIVSNDSKKILVQYGSWNRNFWYLWHLDKNTYIEDETTVDWKDDLQFSPDSKYFFTEERVWNAISGKFIKSFKSDILKKIKKISYDDKYVLLDYAGYTKTPYTEDFYEKNFLNELEIGKLTKDCECTERINYDCYINAGKWFHTNISDNLEYIVATDTEDRSILLSKANFQLNKRQNETPLFKISVFNDNEWISLTPDGFYNSSPNGDKHVHIRYNLDVYDLTQFTKAYFQPEVLIARAFGKTEPQCVTYYGNILLSSPPPLISAVQNDIIDNCLPVNLRVLNYGNNTVTDVSFFRNGKYLGNSKKEFKNYVISEKIDSIEMNIPIDLENGKNYIEIVANTEICYGIQTIILESDFIEKKESDLYVLSIGINKYMQTELNPTTSFLPNLIHAVEDSKAMSLVLEEKLSDYKNIHITQINDDVAITPNKENILKSISMFDKMSENDDAIIFIAAHGLTNKGVFYIFPNDYKTVAYSSDIIDYSSAISIEEILSKLTFLGRKIVLLDSCMSGGIQNNYYVKTLQNKSVAILTAAQENELAQENSKTGGLFTQSLISYLKNQNPEDYNLNEMANYIYDEVRNLSRFEKRGRIKQSPYFCIPEGFSNFSFK